MCVLSIKVPIRKKSGNLFYDPLEEWYAIKFYFKLGKMQQKRMECFRLLFNHLAWIEDQFLSGIRDSRKVGSLWEMMRVGIGVRKSEHQSWLALGLGLLCWGFKGVQEKIPLEEASTLQIRSVAFPPGECTSLQLHAYKWILLHIVLLKDHKISFQTFFIWALLLIVHI